jgi:predicted PurR-regulated permease PerM
VTTPWYVNKFFRYSVGILLVLLITLVFYQVAFLLEPIFDFFSILATPILISFVFYYLLRPIIYFLENLNIPRFVSILAIYIITVLVLVFFFAYVGPILGKQITALADFSVNAIERMKSTSEINLFGMFKINLNEEVQQRFLGVIQGITSVISQNLLNFVGKVTHIAAVLAVIPFVVFYLLKDDKHFSLGFLRYIPENFAREIRKILHNIDSTLSEYVQGLVIVSTSVGTMLLIGYLIIGLNYALILALIALVLTTIPYLGPFLAITPAILVGLAESPFMVLKVVIVFFIVQQLESNLISPQIIGQRLKIHPLTLILLLLAAGSLYGLPGLILATPMYALTKVIIENLYKIYNLRYGRTEEITDQSAEN